MNLASKASQILSLAGALAAVVSCQRDQRSVTDPTPKARPLTEVTSSSSTDISPTADTYLNTDALNHSTETSLNLYTWQNFQVANATVMKFSLASIPPGSVITSATLNLYLTSFDASADAIYTVTAHKVINKNPDLAAANGFKYDGVHDWTHNTCCQNGAFLAQSDIGPAVDTKGIDKAVGFKQWNVTSIVQDWFGNPASNFGLLVNSDATKLADRWRFFSSSESSISGQHPFLTVVYTTSATAPGTVTDLAVASVTSNSATLSFTEVDDGTGQPAKYDVRYAVAPISWGSATSVTQGTCATPVLGTAIGAHRTCTVLGLSSSTSYDFELVAYRGTLDQDAVFGELSNIASAMTPAVGGSWPNEPAGFQQLNDQPWTCASPLQFDRLCNGWNYLRRTSTKPADIISDAAAPLSPSDVLRIIFTTDMTPNTEPGVNWIGLPNVSEIYTAWWIKLSSNWTASPAGAGKITFLKASGADQVYTGYYHQGGDEVNGWIAGPPYRIGVNTEWAPYGQRIWLPNATTTFINPGEWHRIEVYYKWETNPGASGNGIIRWWVDGVLNGDYTNVTYPASNGFTQFEYGPTRQEVPPTEQYMYIDHTYVSRP